MDLLLSPALERALCDFISSTDFLGYVACALVLLSFCMQAMVPLRLVALVSNIAFIAYGWAAKLMPILILHVLLAVINLATLHQKLAASAPNKVDQTSPSAGTASSPRE